MHQCIKSILFWDDTLHVSDGLPVCLLLSAWWQADSSICLTNAFCCMYSFELLTMDGKTVRNM